MKKKWIILALPILAVLTIWVTIHFKALLFDWAMGPMRIHSTVADGELISNGQLEIRPLSEYFVFPETSFEAISYKEKAERVESGFNAQCFFAMETVEPSPLDPFAPLPPDPFSELHSPGPDLKTTFVGSAATIDAEFSSGFGFFYATIPIWLLLLASFFPLLLIIWKKRERGSSKPKEAH